MLMAQPLGLIPDWQYSSDPAINIKINPHVMIPPEWPAGQRTVQPIGYVAQKTHGDPLAGLGITMATWKAPLAGVAGIDFFDSWAWRNKKWIVLGGVGLIGVGLLASVGAILR